MKIMRCDRELETPHLDRTLRDWGHELTLIPESIDEDELCGAMAECELLLMCYTPITSRVIASASRLRGIVKYGVGIDAIDIPFAHAHGIAVVNIPTYAEETVAEGAFAMLIALAKKLTSLQRALSKKDWVWPTACWLGRDIAGKTVGIVGCGKIGSNMARMAGAGFRARVVGYDPNKSSMEMQALGIEACDDLHGMLATCDFVSLHVALSDSTRHLIGAAELAAMKPTAILINSARGALVDEEALLHALQGGSIAGAGLDVFSQEPLNQKDHPLRALYSMENVILMPHLSFYTAEAMDRLESETLERCKEIIEGRPVTICSTDPRLQGGPA
ncbi:MAG: C-terminal binding protein [bacterium]|nr:C-terminal binding protein [bacterium]